MKSQTLVFIHGMYMTPLCWEKWVDYFQARGYHCLAPAWPGRDRPIEELRQSGPNSPLSQLTLRDVTEHLAKTNMGLGEKPALIGHSMGGLVVQLLLQRGLAIAGVAIDSAPPQGVFTPAWSFVKANWPHINPFAPQNQPVQMSLARFQYAFVNSLPLAQQQAAYARYVMPESRRVPAQSLTSVARIDFKRTHPPLLLIAGSADHIIPAGLNRSNYERYQNSPSPTDFKEFAGRTHFIIGQDNWEEVADFVAQWLKDK